MTRVPGKMEKKMAKKNSGMTNQKQRDNISVDVGRLAVALQQLGQAQNQLAKIVNENAQAVSEQLGDAALSIEALLEVLEWDGEDQTNIKERFQVKVKELHIRNLEKDAQERRDMVKKSLEEKKIVATTKVTEGSLLCLAVKKPDGSPCYPTFSYEMFGSIKPELQAVLKDKEVGAIVTDPANGKAVEILELYEQAQEPAEDSNNSEE